ncbi:MAG: hypothetical protein F6K21_32790 [Symploca sp. SIO2D2]|nr:hypothetical protein [Symploca sp. SIO2D2]
MPKTDELDGNDLLNQLEVLDAFLRSKVLSESTRARRRRKKPNHSAMPGLQWPKLDEYRQP